MFLSTAISAIDKVNGEIPNLYQDMKGAEERMFLLNAFGLLNKNLSNLKGQIPAKFLNLSSEDMDAYILKHYYSMKSTKKDDSIIDIILSSR